MSAAVQVCRLAMRQEGDNWNAYMAKPDTMEGALYLGSIRMALLVGNEPLRQRFLILMRDALAASINAALGEQPTFTAPQAAPEHEKAGNA